MTSEADIEDCVDCVDCVVIGAGVVGLAIARANAFYAEVRKYWPALKDDTLIAGYAGMRPKINSPTEPAADFVIHGPKDHGVDGLVNLFGIESPGLTSSMAIGQYVSELLA